MRVKKSLAVVIVFLSLLLGCQTVPEETDGTTKAEKLTKAAHFNSQLGIGYLQQGDIQRAKKKLLVALKQAPNSPVVWSAMAYYFETTEEDDKASYYYRKAIQLSNSSGAQLNNYGAFLCRQGKYADANHYFLKAANDTNYVNTAGAYENAGLCAMAIPDIKLAKIYFNKAIAQDPRRSQAVYELSTLYLKEKRYQSVLKIVDNYQKAASFSAPTTWLAYKAAKAMGNVKVARNYSWILKTRFAKSPEYHQLLVSNKHYDKQSNGVS